MTGVHPVWLLLLAFAFPPRGDARQAGLSPCRVAGLQARCGSVVVPEDRARPRGRRLALRVVVVSAASRPAAADAVFFLSGGPGQAASEGVGSVAAELAQLREHRDLVFVDQRGTAGEHRLVCSLGGLAGQVRAWVTAEFAPGAVARCRRAWRANPARYTTADAVLDLEDARRMLGYPRVDLVGVSYGTRPALEYLRRYPERVRTVTLRGLYPAAAPLPLEVARDAQAALERVFAACAADAACHARHPDPAADLRRALDLAERRPGSFTLPGGEVVRADRALLAGSVLFALYSHSRAQAIPDQVSEAAAGRPQGLLELGVGGILPTLGSVSLGSYLAVVCSEDTPQFSDSTAVAEARGTFLGPGLSLGLRRACAGWPHDPPDPERLRPVRGNTPVLIISGTDDPVAPPRWATAVLAGLPNGTHLVIPATGHLPAFPPCASAATARLIEQGSTQGLPASCQSSVAAAPASSLPPAGDSAFAADTLAATAQVGGSWALFWPTATGPRESGALLLEQSGNDVRAELQGLGTLQAAGRVRGNELRVSGTRLNFAFELAAVVRGDTLRGDLSMLGMHRPFTGVRRH